MIVDFLFRLDANKDTGAGHLMRCMAFMERLKKLGFHLGVWGNVDEHYRQIIDPVGNYYSNLDECPGCRCFVIDHYGCFEKVLKIVPKAIPVILLEDLVDRKSQRPMMVISVFGEEGRLQENYPNAIVYTGLGCQLFRYKVDLLKGLHQRKMADVQINRRKTVIVSLGWSDQSETLTALIQSVVQIFSKDVDVKVFGSLPEGINFSDNVSCSRVISEEFLKIACEASLVICGAGQTLMEMVHIGLPVIGVVIADNQKRCGELLKSHGVPIIVKGEEFTDSLQFALCRCAPSLLKSPSSDQEEGSGFLLGNSQHALGRDQSALFSTKELELLKKMMALLK